jgi:tetratricopeptide (TPR) repeat protein
MSTRGSGVWTEAASQRLLRSVSAGAFLTAIFPILATANQALQEDSQNAASSAASSAARDAGVTFLQPHLYTSDNSAAVAKVEHLSRRLAQYPRDVDALIERGLAYELELGETAKGRADLEKATRLAPRNAKAWDALGAVLLKDSPKEAVGALDKAVRLGRRGPKTFVNRGMGHQILGDHQRALADFTRAIELDPTRGNAYIWRARLHLTMGKPELELADYDRAIETEPNELSYRVMRATAHFDRSNFDKAVADVEAAIRLNPGDAGVHYQATTDRVLKPEALAHGELQLRKMLQDRPVMAEHVTSGDALWTWAVRKFAGEDMGTLIEWDPTSPAPFPASSRPPEAGIAPGILVSATRFDSPDSPPYNFDELWSSAVFELHNVTSSAEWDEIYEQARQGRLSRDEYTLAMLNSEERATQKMRAFYVRYYLPWLRSKNLEPRMPYEWGCTTFNGMIGDARKVLLTWGNDYRIPHYKAAYDMLRGYEEFTRGALDRARAHFDAALANKTSLPAVSMLWLYEISAHTALLQRDAERAAADYTAALALSPGKLENVLKRGYAWTLLGKWDEALADLDESVRIDPQSLEARVNRAEVLSKLGKHDAALKEMTTVLEMQPPNAELLARRAYHAKELGRWEQAFGDLDQAVALAPTQPVYFGLRGTFRIQRGEYDAGIADVLAAMRLNPGDAGADYQPVGDKVLSPEALAHGEEQVRKMLTDRPRMAEHVTPGDKIWNWAVRKFAGEDLGTLVDWDSGPSQPFLGQTSWPAGAARPTIRVSPTRIDLPENPPCSFDVLWGVAAFELHNVGSYENFRNLEQQAAQGDLSREEFVLATLEAEERTLQQTRAFYVKHFLPWQRAKNLPTDPFRWYCETFVVQIETMSKAERFHNSSHWPYLSARYDELRTESEIDAERSDADDRLVKRRSDETEKNICKSSPGVIRCDRRYGRILRPRKLFARRGSF